MLSKCHRQFLPQKHCNRLQYKNKLTLSGFIYANLKKFKAKSLKSCKIDKRINKTEEREERIGYTYKYNKRN